MNSRLILLFFIISYFGLTTSFAAELTQDSRINLNDTITNAVIDVEYKPVDNSGLIWKDELELARVIFTLDGNGIRITLPNADTAKVMILDKKGTKKLKSILYVAPAVIDISDLKKGSYQLIMKSHHVVVVKTFKKDRRKIFRFRSKTDAAIDNSK